MWIKHPQHGMVVLIFHEAHIQRLLSEGGTEVEDPTSTLAGATEETRKEAADDASTVNNVKLDHASTGNDIRPEPARKRKPAIQRSASTRQTRRVKG